MAQTRLLLFNNEQLSAWHWRASGPVFEARFAQDQEGLKAFAAYAANSGSSIFRLLADGPDEVHKMVIARRELNRASKRANGDSDD